MVFYSRPAVRASAPMTAPDMIAPCTTCRRVIAVLGIGLLARLTVHVELVINLKTGKALGLTVPHELLAPRR
jgi:hypothetical protein